VKVLNDILGYENLKIYQDLDFFCFSLDSVLLANFATIRLRDKNICDFGTGNAVIPLILSKRTSSNIIGVEIQEKLYMLANESILYNNLDKQIKIINSDIADKEKFDFNEYFDLILCNPPYFPISEGSNVNLSIEKRIARHEFCMDLRKMLKVAKKSLKNNGNLAIVHRPERLMEILTLMIEYGIEPKRIRFVYEKYGKDSNIILVEGQKAGKKGLKVESPLILYNSDGSMTEEYSSITKEVRK